MCADDSGGIARTSDDNAKGARTVRHMQPRAIVTLTENATAVGEAIRGDRQPIREAAVRSDGTVLVKLISPGWGSSGYYSAAMLERDGPKVFTAGTKMYWDHPTVTETHERPERSLRDLAGELVTTARWEANGPDGAGLYGDSKVFSPFRENLGELAPHIGVSIRAQGTAVQGEAEGRTGPIIDELLSAMSVDFVTEAGRGGKVLELFEAARRQNRQHLERLREAGVFSAEETRDLLRNALRSALEGENRWIWVRDFGDDWVVFEDEGSGAPDPGYFRCSYSLSDAGEVALGDAIKVMQHTEWLPAAPSSIQESREDSMPLTPEQQAELAEAKKAIDEKADLQKQLDEAKAAAARANEALLVVAADKAVRAELATVQLPDVTKARLVETLTANPPVKDDALDGDALKTKIAEAVKAEVEYLAAVSGTSGGVRGLGSTTDPTGAGSTISADEADKKLESAFAGLGLSESAAKIAVQGRN